MERKIELSIEELTQQITNAYMSGLKVWQMQKKIEIIAPTEEMPSNDPKDKYWSIENWQIWKLKAIWSYKGFNNNSEYDHNIWKKLLQKLYEVQSCTQLSYNEAESFRKQLYAQTQDEILDFVTN